MTKKAVAQDIISRVWALRQAGDTEAADALRTHAEAAVKACAPKDRKAMSAALEDAYLVTPPSGELAISSYHDVAGVDDVVQEGVGRIRSAVDEGLKTADMARSIAETLLTARLKMTNQAGLPDIIASRKFTKNIARDMFLVAREGVSQEDVHRWATHESLAKAVRNRMSDVVVAYLRSLDEEPEKFPAMELAQARFPDLSPTEAVYALYDAEGFALPRKGRTELAREDARQRRALMQAAIDGKLPASAEEPAEADLGAVERMETSLVRYARRAEKLPDGERAKAKARLNAVIASLAAEAAKL